MQEFQPGCEETLSPMRADRQRHRLSAEVVRSPSLEVFKSQLDEALSGLV